MKKQICNERGEASLLVVILALCMLIVLAGVCEYFRIHIIAKGVRTTLEQSVISVVTSNYDETYPTLREGYSAGYMWNTNNYIQVIDFGDVTKQVKGTLGLASESGKLVKKAGDKTDFILSDLRIDIVNASFRGQADDQFFADVYMDIEIPLSFGFLQKIPLKMTLKTQAEFMPKF